MKEEKRNTGEEVITSTEDPTSTSPSCLVNINQVAHQLLVNGRGTMPTKPKCLVLLTVDGIPSLVSAFSEEEYKKFIAALKYNKAAGIDDVLVEQHSSQVVANNTQQIPHRG